MKKTVSWSSETLKRNRELPKALDDDDAESDSATPPTKSKSVSVENKKGVTSAAVNSRIQQMIAMQKAQNATMRQLMSAGGDAGSASPSGLRDLVVRSDMGKAAGMGFAPAPEEVRGVVEREAAATVTASQQRHPPTHPRTLHDTVTMKTQPIKPPAITRGPPYTESELTARPADGGIHYQGSRNKTHTNPASSFQTPPGIPPADPYHLATHLPPAALLSTPPHLHPKIPRFSSDSSSCDSPVSYNSVLDQYSTPGAVRERKRQQLQTIASQEQMMAEQYDGDELLNLRATPTTETVVEEFNWESIVTTSREYLPAMMPPMPSLGRDDRRHVYGYGATAAGYDNNVGGLDRDEVTAGERMVAPKVSNRNLKRHGDAIGTERESLMSSPTHNSPADVTPDDALPSTESHTQHLFHYGGRNGGGDGPPASVNVHPEYDYHSAYHGADGSDHHRRGLFGAAHHSQRSRRRTPRNALWNILAYPFRCLHENEQLGRSFCFGAIDGMLTGAGILSACVGLGLLPRRARTVASPLGTEESAHTEWTLIALTLAACFSDGICMAVGHVWSTRLVAGSTYEERKEELRNFETCRSDAKARLVDSLLSRGMLKIDAMSLADTLEGYPDMFVSALLGEGFCGQGNNTVCGMSGLGSGGGGSGGMVRVPSGGASIPSQRQAVPQHHLMDNAWDIPAPAYGPGEMHHGLKYESYSDFSDYQQDPDLKTFTETLSDSRLEGFFMMLSFGSFSVVPILIYSFLPYVVDYVTSTRDPNNVLTHDHPPPNSTLVMLSLGATTVVMFFLGAWKSHFYSSHWCLFGMETIGILLLCIATAYSVGAGCGFLIDSHFQEKRVGLFS